MPAPTALTPTTARTTHVGFADWPIYNTVDDLVHHSSLVVVAQVGTIQPSTQDPDRPGTPPNKKGTGLVSTVFEFLVEQVVFRSEGPEPAGAVAVNSGNGTVDGVRWVVSGEPWYREGDRYLLFLKWFPDNTVFADAGGVQAVYTVDPRGRLASVDDPYLHSPVMDRINGSALDELIGLVRATQKAAKK